MAKLCAKGKAAAKRRFKVYPSAYANMYGSAVCSGKVTPGGKKKKKSKQKKITNIIYWGTVDPLDLYVGSKKK